jgi:hypothetical protein
MYKQSPSRLTVELYPVEQDAVDQSDSGEPEP